MFREPKHLMELCGKDGWRRGLSYLSYQALKSHRPPGSPEAEQLSATLEWFENRFAEPPDPEHGKAHAFSKRILMNRGHVLVFLMNPAVPPDNNSSERAVRNITVK